MSIKYNYNHHILSIFNPIEVTNGIFPVLFQVSENTLTKEKMSVFYDISILLKYEDDSISM